MARHIEAMDLPRFRELVGSTLLNNHSPTLVVHVTTLNPKQTGIPPPQKPGAAGAAPIAGAALATPAVVKGAATEERGGAFDGIVDAQRVWDSAEAVKGFRKSAQWEHLDGQIKL